MQMAGLGLVFFKVCLVRLRDFEVRMHDANGWAGPGLVSFKVCLIRLHDFEAHSDA